MESTSRPRGRFSGRLHARRRPLVALAFGALLLSVLPRRVAGEVRIALAWDGAALLYLVLALGLMVRSRPADMRRRAADEAASMAANLFVSLAGASFSLVTVGVVLVAAQALPPDERARHLALCGATIFLSWLTVHTFFAVHYAHDYYDDADDVPGGPTKQGLRFPSEPQPDYWDFMYYSFVVGMTGQVSDVEVAGREMRRTTLVHGMISFVFNTVILAFAVNIAAGLI